MGFCCESLALTCTMDNGDVPGATAFTTSPRRVPLPLTPGVLGGRVAEMMYWPLSLNGCETMEISCAPPFERKPPCCTSSTLITFGPYCTSYGMELRSFMFSTTRPMVDVC